MTALLTIRGLSVSYPAPPGSSRSAGRVSAVQDVDLTVDRGEVVAVVGESGSGKSTTAHAITGLLAPGAQIDSGSIGFGDLDLTRLGHRQFQAVRGRRIALIPQDPATALNPVQRIGTQVAETLQVHGLAGRRAARAQAVELLDRAGVPDAAARAQQYPHELSGGLRQRVLIAIAIAAQPQLIVADEPTSALDVTVQRRILDHLDSLRRELGTALVLITHDLAVAADRAQRIAVMKDGRLVETGSSAALLRAPAEAYTQRLVQAAPQRSSPSTRAELPDAPALVVAEDLRKAFSLGGGRLQAVDDVSFRIDRGRTLALVGESGSGKSTTARLLLRLIESDGGSVRFDGADIAGLRGRGLRELRRRMQVVYQNPYSSLDPRFTVEELITEPLRAFRVGNRAARAAELVDRVALPASVLRRRPGQLSGGQRQRVAIARALALSPDLVVLDEPVSALDALVQAQVLDLLAELQAELGVSYLFISHDLAVVRQVAHTVAVMQRGRVVEQGAVSSVFREPQHPYTRELLAAVAGSATLEATTLEATR